MLSYCQTASNQKAGMNHGTSGASFHNLFFFSTVPYCTCLLDTVKMKMQTFSFAS